MDLSSTLELPNPLKVAIRMAKNSTYKQRLGACIVKHKRRISVGWNNIRSNGNTGRDVYDYRNQYHAEFMAIMSSPCNLEGGHIYVVRINRLGVTRLAKPCSNCIHLLIEHGIKRVTYTTNGGGYETASL